MAADHARELQSAPAKCSSVMRWDAGLHSPFLLKLRPARHCCHFAPRICNEAVVFRFLYLYRSKLLASPAPASALIPCHPASFSREGGPARPSWIPSHGIARSWPPPFSARRFVLRMPAPEAIAAGLMASQKSSPVAVTVVSYISSDVAQQGLMAIPALVGQIFQVFIGSALVPVFSKIVKRWEGREGALLLGVQGQEHGSTGGQEQGAAEGQGLPAKPDLAKPSSEGAAKSFETEGWASEAKSLGRDEEEGAGAEGSSEGRSHHGELPAREAGAGYRMQRGSGARLDGEPGGQGQQQLQHVGGAADSTLHRRQPAAGN
jgi:hypothetical protein